MNNEELEKLSTGYFANLDVPSEKLSSSDSNILHISIFDHWLSSDEADCCKELSYSIAVKSGNEERYLEGEKKLLGFYRSLSRGGVICGRPRIPVVLEEHDSQLQAVFLNSLREVRLADMFFIEPAVRLVAGYDRTDLIVARSVDALDLVKRKALIAGLFALP